MIACSLFSRADPGIFAVSGLDIQKEYDIKESDFGLLLSALYIGNIIGTLICPFIFRRVHVRYIIFGAITLNAAFTIVFPLTSNYVGLFISRILVGVFQVMHLYHYYIVGSCCSILPSMDRLMCCSRVENIPNGFVLYDISSWS